MIERILDERGEGMLLVTGITGHSGNYFLQELMKNRYKGRIRCIVRETSDTSRLDSSGLDIEKVVGDLEDTDFIDKAMTDVDTVLHIYNIHYSKLIVQKAIQHKVKRVILVHTTGIYSKYKNASKAYRQIEKQVIDRIEHSNNQISLTIIRPTMIYGDLCDRNISRFIRILGKSRIIPVINGGRNLLQPVNARDLGKVYDKVVTQPENTSGKYYDISGDRPISMIDLLKLISEELHKKTLFISIPLRLGIMLAKGLKLLSFHRMDYVEQVQRMGEDRSYSHERAEEDFGYDPMTIEEGIHLEVQEYLKDRAEKNKKVGKSH